MSAENVAVIRSIYDAFAVGDVPGVLGGMDAGIVWNEANNFPYADGNPYVGPMAVAEGVFARCGSEWDGFAAVPDELIDGGDTVVALGHYLGTYKSTGKAQRTQFAHVWRLAGGKATQFQQYADTLHVAQVIAA
jgi:ketosteroid isomerase-like protein